MTNRDDPLLEIERNSRRGWWHRSRAWILALLLTGWAGWESIRAPNLQQRPATATHGVPPGAVDSLSNARTGATQVPKADHDLSPGVPEIDFPLMATLNFRTGAAPYALDSLNNKMVRLLAFVLPLDDMTQETASFLLVPYVGACVHTPPPPPNQLVQVVMLNSVKVPVAWWTPVFIEGILHIEQIDSPYGKASFRMDGVRAIDYVTKRLINVGVSH